MSGRIVRHISEYHYRSLQVDQAFGGCWTPRAIHTRAHRADGRRTARARGDMMRMDPKAGCVWFAEAGGRTIRSYPRGKTPRTTEAAGDFRQRLIAATDGDSVRSHVTGSGRIQVWSSIAGDLTARAAGIYAALIFRCPKSTCMTQSPASSGYATQPISKGDRLTSDSPQTGPSGERLDGTGGIPEGRGHRTERHRSCDLGLSQHRRGAHLLPHSAGRTPLGGRHRHPAAGHRAGDRRFSLPRLPPP